MRPILKVTVEKSWESRVWRPNGSTNRPESDEGHRGNYSRGERNCRKVAWGHQFMRRGGGQNIKNLSNYLNGGARRDAQKKGMDPHERLCKTFMVKTL